MSGGGGWGERPGQPEAPFDLRLLTAFGVLDGELHFSRAAVQLGYAQPALSRQIARLETQLGVVLFERDAHGVRLTAAGEAFRTPAAESLNAARRAAADARDAVHGISGSLALAVGQGVLVLVRDALRAFADAHPQVDLEIVSVTDAAGLEAVNRGRAAAALVWSDAAAPAGFEESALQVARVPVGVRLLDSNPLAQQATVSVDALADQRLVLFPRHAGPDQHDRIVAALGGPARPGGVQEIVLIGAARTEMMRALDPQAFTVGPLELDLDDGTGGVVVRPMTPPLPEALIWLVWATSPRGPLGALVKGWSVLPELERPLRQEHVGLPRQAPRR